MKSCKGRIWKLGNDVNTDQIIPGRYLDNYSPSHLASHALEGARKDFAGAVRAGDIVLAGRNFGCGSSREQAVMALVHSGVRSVVAQSYARIFYRNAINLGLYAFSSAEAYESFEDGEVAVIDLEAGTITSEDRTRAVRLGSIPEKAQEILKYGGLVPYIKATLAKSRDD